MRTYPTGEDIDDVLAIILEADQPRDTDNVTNFLDNDSARDIVLEMELENLDNQGADSHVIKGIKFSKPGEPCGLQEHS